MYVMHKICDYWFLTSSFAFVWKIVWDLWQSCANAALSAVIFWRPSYVSSHWSGSISPNRRSKSTNALSNSFSRISSQRNDSEAAMFSVYVYIWTVFIFFSKFLRMRISWLDTRLDNQIRKFYKIVNDANTFYLISEQKPDCCKFHSNCCLSISWRLIINHRLL